MLPRSLNKESGWTNAPLYAAPEPVADGARDGMEKTRGAGGLAGTCGLTAEPLHPGWFRPSTAPDKKSLCRGFIAINQGAKGGCLKISTRDLVLGQCGEIFIELGKPSEGM